MVSHLPEIDLELDGWQSRSIQLLLYLAFVCSMPWQTFKGLDIGTKPGCSIKFFFFASLNPNKRGWRIFGRYSAISTVIVSPLIILLVLDTLWTHRRKEMERRRHRNGDREHLNDYYYPQPALSPWARINRSVWTLLASACAVAFIEMTIIVNDMDMSAGLITSAGQFIPLTIGAYVLLMVILSLLKMACWRVIRRLSSRYGYSERVERLFPSNHHGDASSDRNSREAHELTSVTVGRGDAVHDEDEGTRNRGSSQRVIRQAPPGLNGQAAEVPSSPVEASTRATTSHAEVRRHGTW